MSDFLAQIRSQKKSLVASSTQQRSLSTIRTLAEESVEALDIVKACEESPAIIGECRRVDLNGEYDPSSLSAQYQKGGASIVSVVTDSAKNGGSIEHLKAVREAVTTPVIMRDFIVDEYQVYEARAYGADSHWLCSSLLDLAELQYFIEIGRDYKMEAIIEVCCRRQLELVLRTDCKLLCINAPDLEMIEAGEEGGLADLAQAVKKEGSRLLVSETSINTPQDVVMMHRLGYNAFIASKEAQLHPDPAKIISALVKAPIT